MEQHQKSPYAGIVEIFLDEWLPEPATPAGYAALIHAYGLRVPLPRSRSAISTKHKVRTEEGWHLLTPRHMPEATLAGHLAFALKYEGVDLLVLKKLFDVTGPEPVERMVAASPTGTYARRVWFLYEWLTGTVIARDDAPATGYVDAVDTSLQFGIDKGNSTRHRIRDNMPGTPAFCPMVSKTDRIAELQERDLAARARETVSRVAPDVMARAAAFMLLEDTRSSFQIEGESPGKDRIHRWGKAVAQAGRRPIGIEELCRLQSIVLEGNSLVKLGLRDEEGFIGTHDRFSHEPIPSHISARHRDLPGLVTGLVDYEKLAVGRQDPVVTAGALAFGFVFIHPFADGNGRIHRYLIHHVLAETDFSPKGMVFPVSSVMADDIDAYRKALESYSSEILPLVSWKADSRGNVTIEGETADLYRYFDATPQVEFLYSCVARTIEHDLPAETALLKSHDTFRRELRNAIDIPHRLEELAFSFLHSNGGKLSKRARQKELSELDDGQVELLEGIYSDAFAEEPAEEAGMAP